MPRYKVEYPISFGKGRRARRGVLTLSEGDAAPLLACGALSGPVPDDDVIPGYWIALKGVGTHSVAGLCFGPQGLGVAADALSAELLETLRDDPRLVVEEVEFSVDEAEQLATAGDHVKQNSSDSASTPEGGVPPSGEADEGLSEREHTLRAYVADLKADGKGKPKVGDARKATGIDDLSGAEIAAAWAG